MRCACSNVWFRGKSGHPNSLKTRTFSEKIAVSQFLDFCTQTKAAPGRFRVNNGPDGYETSRPVYLKQTQTTEVIRPALLVRFVP